MLKHLNFHINQIYLMMGYQCNLKCKYCIEHNVVNHAMPKEINPQIVDWMIDVAQNIGGFNVLFWGGEPLVYFDTMKKVVEMIKEKDINHNISFSMVTNGKLLNNKTIPWIKENLKGFGLSWDGRNTERTRGYDVIKENKENLFKLDDWGFTGVLSSFNYPKDYLDDCYEIEKEYGKEIHVNIDNLMQYEDLPDAELKKFDESKFYGQMRDICDAYIDYYMNGTEINPNYIRWIEEEFQRIAEGKKITRLYCGNGGENINLDLQGNLYCCHGDIDPVGTINDNYFDVLKNINDKDNTIQHGIDGCNECPVQVMCRNGCPKVPQHSRDEFYCTMNNLRFYPILETYYEIERLKGEEFFQKLQENKKFMEREIK